MEIGRGSRSGGRIVAVGVALVAALGAAGCTGDGTRLTGMVSTLQPRVCIAKQAAAGECFRPAAAVTRAHVAVGDCVAVETDSVGGAIRRIRLVDRTEHTADCPAGQLPIGAPSPTSTGVSNCGPGLYQVAAPSGLVAAGGCGGHLQPGGAAAFTVQVGDLISVRPLLAEHFQRGLPQPVSADDGVLAPVGSDPARAWFRASSPGQTSLRATTYYCGSYSGSTTPARDHWQTCPVVDVRVTGTSP